ncbi:MAG TPA: hypothetical protein VN861_17870 [Candidatus Acidoferrales bacterium]|nr:hypothetical protein [Candidatus Acidoferrales bacterium]
MDGTDQVRRILFLRGLTLYRISQQSAQMFGQSSLFFIPHNLRYDLKVSSGRLSIHQLFALSKITNFRLYDWLTVFGFRIDEISRLQVLIPRQHSALLDSSVYDTQARIPWFAERFHVQLIPAIAPLRQLLTRTAPRRAVELLPLRKTKFLYAKVGKEDLLAFPDIAPGSIIRIDALRSTELPSNAKTHPDNLIFFVERDIGFTCSRLLYRGNSRVVLSSPQLPFAQAELTVGNELRILGVVDAEFRPMLIQHPAQEQSTPVSNRRRQPLHISNSQTSLKDLIRLSRLQVGLSFREASKLTRWIAQTLTDQLYFAAASTLSDYETFSVPPRRIQKIITLCVLYSIVFRDFLSVSGLSLESAGSEPIPDEFMPRQMIYRGRESDILSAEAVSKESQVGFLDALIEQWEEIPLFLRSSLNELAGISNFSLSDVYWVGGDRSPIHPWLVNATFVVINRRVKRPVESISTTFWEQPLYLLLARNGRYFCGCCTFQHGLVVVHPYPDRPFSPRQFRNGTDAEVIGQVTAILRRLG